MKHAISGSKNEHGETLNTKYLQRGNDDCWIDVSILIYLLADQRVPVISVFWGLSLENTHYLDPTLVDVNLVSTYWLLCAEYPMKEASKSLVGSLIINSLIKMH